MSRGQKNVWVAAGDGELDRVKELVEEQSTSANAQDDFGYSPMHAAASYGHIHVLEYLLSKGGDVNLADNDGDTPIYTTETIEVARFLVNHGAILDRRNNENISPIEHLELECPEVAADLRSSLSPGTIPTGTSHQQVIQVSQHQQNIVSERLTSSLMESVGDIMQRAEAEGRDPDEELRQVVGRTILDGVQVGFQMTQGEGGGTEEPLNGEHASKRPRTDST